MKIALFFDLPSGGGKRTIFDIVRRLGGQHTIDSYSYNIAAHDFGDIRPYVRQYKVYPLRQLGMMRSPFGRINPVIRIANVMQAKRLARAISREIETGGYDLAFVQPCQVEFAPSVLRYILSIPTVYYCHEPPRAFYEEMPARPYDRQERSYRKLLNRLDPLPALYQRTLLANDRENIHHAGQVLVNSRYMAGVFEQTYHRPAKVRYMGIDTQKFRPLGVPREPFFLSVGSLTRLKGFDFLVRALGQLDSHDRYPLTIVSNFQVAEERAYLEGLAREQSVTLTLLDGVTDERLVDLYNRATLTLYSPVREPFGLVPVESMACATPVVTISEGGVSESILPGQTGLFVERDPRAFAAAIKQLVDTPALRAEFGASGRRQALAKWSWDVVMPEIEKTLMDACSTTEPRDTMKTIDRTMEEA